jgi:hypothetical protein
VTTETSRVVVGISDEAHAAPISRYGEDYSRYGYAGRTSELTRLATALGRLESRLANSVDGKRIRS